MRQVLNEVLQVLLFCRHHAKLRQELYRINSINKFPYIFVIFFKRKKILNGIY